MPLHIVMGDVSKMDVGAVVCPTDEVMSGGGGVDLALHRAAGAEMRRACDAAGRCSADAPVVTSGFGLPCDLVIHTVGPIWRGGGMGEAAALERCALRALETAAAHGCESVALPLISSGTFGYPKPLALATLTSAVRKFLESHETDVILVVYERDDFEIEAELARRIGGYIDRNLAGDDDEIEADPSRRIDQCDQEVEIDDDLLRRIRESIDQRYASDASEIDPLLLRQVGSSDRSVGACEPTKDAEPSRQIDPSDQGIDRDDIEPRGAAPCPSMPASQGGSSSLEDELGTVEMSFRDALLHKIDERGMTDAECYKRANIDRKLFSKIRCNRDHAPSKDTAISFAIALMLSIAETRDLLERAGFALSRSSKRDVIVEYFIRRGRFDIFEINEALFAFGQKPLCS